MGEPRYGTARNVGRRLEIEGFLELTSPAHLGGSDPLSLTDQPILRDHNGMPFIPGTTLAGVLRSHVHCCMGGGASEHEEITNLFGCRWGEEHEEQSALISEDAPMVEGQRGVTELRDGVKINPKKGTAEAGKKFDREFLPVGTRFRLRFELLLRGDATDASRKGLLITALHGLEEGEISLGARIRRGHGRCRAGGWKYRLSDLSDSRGLLEWLGSQGGVPPGWPQSSMQDVDSVQEFADALFVPVTERQAIPKMTVEMTLRCPASLLIRSGGYGAGEADAVHLRRIHQQDLNRKAPVLSGTSLGGALRQRALKIANTLAGNSREESAQRFVERLFGCEMAQGKKPWASKVWVDESVIEEEPSLLRHARVHIDRWRGSSFEHMLFEEDALFGGKVRVWWHVTMPSNEEIGLMLCLVKDLFTGDLPLGGEAGIGRGILYGEDGTVRISEDNAPREIKLKGDGGGSLVVEQGGDFAGTYFTALSRSLQGGAQ